MNLYEFIKAHDFKGFSLKLIRRFTKQLLSSLILLHRHKVIHCDLKPENILLAHPIHSEIKVIDFGSSCFENEKVYTYIQSRFYRSPEVILGMSYGMPIDMWSLGCILAELFTGYPIFPGENEQEQLACIMEVFGPPEKHLIEKSTRKKLFFDSLGKPRLTVSSKGKRRRPSSKDLRSALKCDDEAFLDFVARCLRWDPARRITPHEAAAHEFITGIKSTSSHSHHLQSSNPRSRVLSSTVTSSYSTHTPAKRINTISGTTPSQHTQHSSHSHASHTRPLPEPPATSFKNGTAVRTNAAKSVSPTKAISSRRVSTVNGNLNGHANGNGTGNPGIGKRQSSLAAMSGGSASSASTSAAILAAGNNHTTGSNSGSLPRVAGGNASGIRSVSAKTDVAAAASAAAMGLVS